MNMPESWRPTSQKAGKVARSKVVKLGALAALGATLAANGCLTIIISPRPIEAPRTHTEVHCGNDDHRQDHRQDHRRETPEEPTK